MSKMLHTCVRVQNLEESIRFYEEAFGFKETHRKDFPEHKFTIVYLAFEGDDYELELTYNYGTDHTKSATDMVISQLALKTLKDFTLNTLQKAMTLQN